MVFEVAEVLVQLVELPLALQETRLAVHPSADATQKGGGEAAAKPASTTGDEAELRSDEGELEGDIRFVLEGIELLTDSVDAGLGGPLFTAADVGLDAQDLARQFAEFLFHLANRFLEVGHIDAPAVEKRVAQ